MVNQMAKVKKILKNCGFEKAVRVRHCARDKDHAISAGTKCLIVKEHMNSKSYCLECAKLIIEHAKSEIETIRIGLFENE